MDSRYNQTKFKFTTGFDLLADRWTNLKLKEPKYTAMYGLIFVLISFFVFGWGLAMVAIIFGVFGAYFAFKQEKSWKLIILNILVVLLGLTSIGLLAGFEDFEDKEQTGKNIPIVEDYLPPEILCFIDQPCELLYLDQTAQLMLEDKASDLKITLEGIGDFQDQISLRAEEYGDVWHFSLNKDYEFKQFHEYLIEFIGLNKENNIAEIKILSSPTPVKIKEWQAVKIALEIAQANNFPSPAAWIRLLENNVWTITIYSEDVLDLYIEVKINAETGEIINVFQGSGA